MAREAYMWQILNETIASYPTNPLRLKTGFLSAITANERKQERQGRYVYQRLCPFLALKLATNMMSAGMSTARSDPRMSMMGLQGLEDPTSLRMKVPDVSSGR